MKALCVTPSRDLEVRDIPTPSDVAPGHVLVDMAASAINHGDKTFLKIPAATGVGLALNADQVWGASGAGKVVAIGDGVPRAYQGKQVAAYRSLSRTSASIGLWCERAQIPYSACVILPDHVSAKDYSGSLVNMMTAYAFLEEIVDAGHRGVIVTAGHSATGQALAFLARSRNVSTILLVRSEAARTALHAIGVEHVIVTRNGFTDQLAALADERHTTAVFDGVGGALLTQIAPHLPMRSTIYCYGFMGGAAPVSIHSTLFMMKDLTIKRFSNFESQTVKDQEKRIAALQALERVIEEPVFKTRVGRSFSYDQIDAAMAYEAQAGDKAILVL